jgi:hypothetical protein
VVYCGGNNVVLGSAVTLLADDRKGLPSWTLLYLNAVAQNARIPLTTPVKALIAKHVKPPTQERGASRDTTCTHPSKGVCKTIRQTTV